MWEMGIELCKELAMQYETETFDYLQLSNILVRQRHLFDIDRMLITYCSISAILFVSAALAYGSIPVHARFMAKSVGWLLLYTTLF